MKPGLTPEQRALVERLRRETGILTVRDKTTFPDSRAPEYGVQYPPMRQNIRGEWQRDDLHRHEREIQMWWRDSPVFPGGVPIGMTNFYQRKGIVELGGDPTFIKIHGKPDICTSEQKRLKALAYAKKWMSQEEIAADEREKQERRARGASAAIDPATATGQALAQALAAALANAGIGAPAAATAVAEPPPAPKKRGLITKVPGEDDE